jgi:hypothetical protein
VVRQRWLDDAESRMFAGNAIEVYRLPG